MGSREYRRVRLRLPARLRWNAPFGQKIELSETVDVSRGGLLLSSGESHAAGVPLWVTFPYDPSVPDGQPEVLARVVRCIATLGNGHAAGAREKISAQTTQECSARPNRLARVARMAAPTFSLAIHFEGLVNPASNGNRARQAPERRGGPRRSLAIPIRVSPEHVPWFEETMSLDFSPRGMRFRSHREYATGELLRIALEDVSSTSWPGSGEFCAKVVRVSPATDGVALDVSVCRAT
jgi:PilZ domain-containing protein